MSGRTAAEEALEGPEPEPRLHPSDKINVNDAIITHTKKLICKCRFIEIKNQYSKDPLSEIMVRRLASAASIRPIILASIPNDREMSMTRDACCGFRYISMR